MGRRLGQHFLKNKNKLKKIAEAAGLKPGDIVIEIGPGHGELTRFLIGTGAIVIVIERDEKLVQELNKNFQFPIFPAAYQNIRKAGSRKMRDNFQIISNFRFSKSQIIVGDALEILPRLIAQLSNYPGAKYKLAGNIPYYITGYLLRIAGDLEYKPESVLFTIQKEVAQRICAKPPKMNLLAASIRVWAEPKIILNLPKRDFNPPPKVDSATLKLTTHNQRLITRELKAYYKFIRILFKQPRKTILNNLRPTTNDQQLLEKKIKEAGVDPKKRPQDLDMNQITNLSRVFNVL